jgi:hypothetical protein
MAAATDLLSADLLPCLLVHLLGSPFRMQLYFLQLAHEQLECSLQRCRGYQSIPVHPCPKSHALLFRQQAAGIASHT